MRRAQGEPQGNLQQGVLRREKTYSAASFTALSSLAWRWLSGRAEQLLLGQQDPCTVFADFLTVASFLSPSRGTNPFATVKLRPTVTNDRSAPIIR